MFKKQTLLRKQKQNEKEKNKKKETSFGGNRNLDN